LEQSIVISFFRSKNKELKGKLVTENPIGPSQDEITRNPKSRSALLNVLEKI
jgi:16S rRNA C1402 N4-methylase RsmH